MNCDICGRPGQRFSGFSFVPLLGDLVAEKDPTNVFVACDDTGCHCLAAMKPDPSNPDDVALWKWRCRSQRAAVRYQVFTERAPKTAAEVDLDRAILTLRGRFPLDPFWAKFDAEVGKTKR